MSAWSKESIKNLRKKLGLSQSELAHRLGCRQQTVSEWELGLYLPANAYSKLLNQFETQNLTEEIFTSTREEAVEYHDHRDFDPAID